MKRSRFNSLWCVLCVVTVGALAWAGTAQAADTFTWSNALSGGNWNDSINWSGSVPASGEGNTADFSTLDITADNTVNLDTPVTIGNIIFGDTNAVTTPAGWVLSGNTLTLAGTTPTITVNVLGTGDVRLGTGKTATISATISGTAGLTKDGVGTLRITNRSNLYTGGTTVLAGTINPVANNNTFSFGGSLTMADNTTFLPDGGIVKVNDPITLTSGKATFLANNAISGANGDLELNCAIDGDGGMIITGTNAVNSRKFELFQANTFAGGVTLKPSTAGPTRIRLEIYTPTSLGTGTLRSELPASTFASLEVGSSSAPQDLYSGAGVANNVDLASGANLNVTTSLSSDGTMYRNLQLSGVISGAGSLTKSTWSYQNNHNRYGEGTLLLSGANTYTGETRIFRGILSASSLNSVIGGSASSSLGAPTTPTAGTITLGCEIIDWADNSGNVTPFAGTLQYTGAGETTDRIISLNGGKGGAVIDQSGTGLLKFTGNMTAPGTDIVTGTARTDNRKALTLQGSTEGTGEIAGAIVDSAAGTAGQLATSLVKAGTGTWTLSGANTYTGGTAVNEGKLAVGSNAALSTGLVTVAGDAAIALGGNVNSVTATALTIGEGAIYEWRFGTGGTTDLINVTGELILGDTWKIKLVDAGGGTPNGFIKYDLFTYGTYSNLPSFTLDNIDHSGVSWDVSNAHIVDDGVSKIYITGLGPTMLPGDANLDGIVDAADYIWIKQNFGMTNAMPADGDLSGDGTVDWADLQMLMTALSASPPVMAPEPCSAMLLVFGVAALLRRRRRVA